MRLGSLPKTGNLSRLPHPSFSQVPSIMRWQVASNVKADEICSIADQMRKLIHAQDRFYALDDAGRGLVEAWKDQGNFSASKWRGLRNLLDLQRYPQSSGQITPHVRAFVEAVNWLGENTNVLPRNPRWPNSSDPNCQFSTVIAWRNGPNGDIVESWFKHNLLSMARLLDHEAAEMHRSTESGPLEADDGETPEDESVSSSAPEGDDLLAKLRPDLPRLSLRILEYIWSRRKVRLNDLHNAVWKNPVQPASQIRAIERLNASLAKYPVSVHAKGEHVILDRPDK